MQVKLRPQCCCSGGTIALVEVLILFSIYGCADKYGYLLETTWLPLDKNGRFAGIRVLTFYLPRQKMAGPDKPYSWAEKIWLPLRHNMATPRQKWVICGHSDAGFLPAQTKMAGQLESDFRCPGLQRYQRIVYGES